MKVLYLDCQMGAAGDMLTAALWELLPEGGREDLLRELNSLGLPGVRFAAEPSVRCGIAGTHMRVTVDGEEEVPGDLDEHHHEPGHPHDHPHGHCHDHEHSHEHDHCHDHEYSHEHEHCHEHGHSHTSMRHIRDIINGLPVSEKVKADAAAVYTLIAEAESHAHGQPVEEIHFHEVGTMDAVADVVAVCMLMERIGADEISASPVHVGSGRVHTAHGILPVPAPATEYILRGVPIYGGSIRCELCTPTGAALLKHFVKDFGPMPAMITERIGYGMGMKDLEAANCVRAALGESADPAGESADPAGAGHVPAAAACFGKSVSPEDGSVCATADASENHVSPEGCSASDKTVPSECGLTPDGSVVELNFNVDDMTAEDIAFAEEQIFAAGAAEVFTIPVNMKKSRPGTLVFVLCPEPKREAVVRAIFRHTTTIGMRETVCSRYTLKRHIETVETGLGPVRRKISSGYGVERAKWEHDDLARIAREKGMSIAEVRTAVEEADQNS